MDSIDDAQAKAELFNTHALNAFRKASRNARGAKACVECGEVITELRQSLGAVRCVACQTEQEAADRGPWR